MGTTAEALRDMRAAGFSDSEINKYAADHRATLRQAGFSDAEIDADFGIKRTDMAPLADYFRQNLERDFPRPAPTAPAAAPVATSPALAPVATEHAPTPATTSPSAVLAGEPVAPAQAPAVSAPVPAASAPAPTPASTPAPAAIPAAAGPAPAAAAPVAASTPAPAPAAVPESHGATGSWANRSFLDYLKSGWGSSVTGLLINKRAPDTAEEHPNLAGRIAQNIGQISGDLPAIVGGAILGGAAGAETGPGAAITAVGGGFALPEALRQTMIDGYTNGDFKSFSDFYSRASGIFFDTLKAWVTGAATGGAGKAVGLLAKPLGAAGSAVAVGSAELATMVTVGAAMEGRVPEPEDFAAAAALLGGAKLSVGVAAKLRNTYAKTGVMPGQILQDAAVDPTVRQDLLSTNVDIPGRYEPLVRGKPATEIEVIGGRQEPAPGVEPKVPTEPEVPMGKEPNAAGASPDPQANVLDHISVGEKEKGKPLSFERAYTALVDDLNPIRQEVKAMTGEKPAVAVDPYSLARLSRGTFGKADQQLLNSTYDFNTYENNGPGLKQVLEPVKDDLNGLRAYAVSKRTLELADRGIESGVSRDDAQAVVDSGGAKYEPVLRQLVDYQNRVTKQLRDSGILSDDAHNAMLEANKDYVPFFRVMDGEAGAGIGRGLNPRNPIKNISGSDRTIVDPIESVIKNTYTYTALAERNAVALKFIQMAEASGHPEDFATKVSPDIKPTQVSEAEMSKFLRDNGIADVPADLLTVFRAARQPLADNEIAVFRDGKREVYEVDKDVAAAFRATDRETAGILTKILAYPSSLLRAGATLSPDFPAKNLIRDQASAFVFNGTVPLWDMMRGAVSIARKDEDFQAWLKGGGANAAMVSLDRDYLQSNLKTLTEDTGLMGRAWNVVTSPIQALRVISELAENSTRVGMFKRALGDATSKEDIQAAAFASREGTLDFARVGAQTRAVNQIIAFSNAQVQGVDRAARAFADNPLGTSARIAAAITIPSILLYEANKDDPRWQDIPRWQKDLFWIVMTKDHIYRIPKPFELGVIFGSGPERILEAWDKSDPQASKGFASSVLGAMSPGVVPTIAAPIIEQFSNKSLFSGNAIVPASTEKLLPEYQYTPYTTELTKALGQMIGTFPGLKESAAASPAIIDNYIRGYTGGLGTYAVQLADKALREAGVLPDPVKPLSTLADVPVVKAFVIRYPSATAQSIQDFYDREASAEKYHATIQYLAKNGDILGLQRELHLAPGQQVDFVKVNAAVANMVRLQGIKDSLGNAAHLVRTIDQNPGVSAEDKRQLIDTLYGSMIQMAHAGNQAFADIDKALGR